MTLLYGFLAEIEMGKDEGETVRLSWCAGREKATPRFPEESSQR